MPSRRVARWLVVAVVAFWACTVCLCATVAGLPVPSYAIRIALGAVVFGLFLRGLPRPQRHRIVDPGSLFVLARRAGVPALPFAIFIVGLWGAAFVDLAVWIMSLA
jgi:hypothetical protein